MSNVVLSGTMPSVGQRPLVVLRPTWPVTLAGIRTEPPVSVPKRKERRAFAERDAGAARGAAGRVVDLPVLRIPRDRPMGIDAKSAEGELDRVRLAHDRPRAGRGTAAPASPRARQRAGSSRGLPAKMGKLSTP